MNARDVINGASKWSCEQSDAIEFLRSLPDDSIDLLFTSPPYMAARTYGRDDVARDCQEWVAWMIHVVKAAAPKVRGLIAINCEGQTSNFCYEPAPFMLMALLHQAGFKLRKPPIFYRIGIPGSGGPDWLRNDYEPIVCVTRGKLPWSDNTACGHPPKWAPGGEMSNRLSDGKRVNQWGPVGSKKGSGKRFHHGKESNGEEKPRPSHKVTRNGTFRHAEDGTVKGGHDRDICAIANPGNVLEFTVGGGGVMGHPLAHENEAPFPLGLPALFVKSFCPPGGIVCDPFSGSGTTCHAAIENGRRFIGCDLRASQVDLCERRMATVTPPLFV